MPMPSGRETVGDVQALQRLNAELIGSWNTSRQSYLDQLRTETDPDERQRLGILLNTANSAIKRLTRKQLELRERVDRAFARGFGGPTAPTGGGGGKGGNGGEGGGGPGDPNAGVKARLREGLDAKRKARQEVMDSFLAVSSELSREEQGTTGLDERLATTPEHKSIIRQAVKAWKAGKQAIMTYEPGPKDDPQKNVPDAYGPPAGTLLAMGNALRDFIEHQQTLLDFYENLGKGKPPAPPSPPPPEPPPFGGGGITITAGFGLEGEEEPGEEPLPPSPEEQLRLDIAQKESWLTAFDTHVTSLSGKDPNSEGWKLENESFASMQVEIGLGLAGMGHAPPATVPATPKVRAHDFEMSNYQDFRYWLTKAIADEKAILFAPTQMVIFRRQPKKKPQPPPPQKPPIAENGGIWIKKPGGKPVKVGEGSKIPPGWEQVPPPKPTALRGGIEPVLTKYHDDLIRDLQSQVNDGVAGAQAKLAKAIEERRRYLANAPSRFAAAQAARARFGRGPSVPFMGPMGHIRKGSPLA